MNAPSPQKTMSWFNPYFTFVVIVIACGSIPKGYDEGGFSASIGLASFKRDFHLLPEQWEHRAGALASRQANISSFGVLGASFGTLLSLLLNDRFGRLRTWQLFVVVWASGLLVQVFSSGILGLLLFARLWSGLGAGGLTVAAPMYLTEIAPARTRGMVVSVYMVVLLGFLTLGFFINYGANKTLPADTRQWRVVQAVPLIPVGLALVGSFFLPDTPRWLMSEDRGDEALAVLRRLRGLTSSASAAADPDREQRTRVEFEEIRAQVVEKHQALKGASGWDILKEIVTTPSYRTRFLLGVVMQTTAQWSGGNGITYYIPQIFRYAGVQGENTSLITSGAYGVVKLVFTMLFTWGLVDYFGRRRCFTAGLLLQCATHVYMAVYAALWLDGGNKPASDAAIASVFVYAAGWSVGLCTIPYLYNSEIYPTRIRSACYAANMALHWFFQFAVVRVTPNMFVSLDVWGAYVFWACVCAAGLVLLWLWAPETKGVPMERVDELFAGPWYLGWRARVALRDDAADDGRGWGGLEKGRVSLDEKERLDS